LDRLGRGGRHDQHRDLASLACFERPQELLERDRLLGLQRCGEISDPSFERRHRHIRQSRKRDEQRKEKSNHFCFWPPKSTLGALVISRSFSTPKLAFGL